MTQGEFPGSLLLQQLGVLVSGSTNRLWLISAQKQLLKGTLNEVRNCQEGWSPVCGASLGEGPRVTCRPRVRTTGPHRWAPATALDPVTTSARQDHPPRWVCFVVPVGSEQGCLLGGACTAHLRSSCKEGQESEHLAFAARTVGGVSASLQDS